MVYREFGNTGIKMSALGFGAMRLPMSEKRGKKIVDYDKAVPMIHKAFSMGVNYIDTAPYYCEKDSETAVGMALNSWGGKEKVYLSTKNPIEDASGEHWRGRLEASLKKLGRDSIDFYHMWGIGLESFRSKIDVADGPIEAARKAKEEGLIKHLSFSFHDDAKNMIPIIDSGYFESVLCQYNLLDRSNEQSIAHAREKGLGVVIMGPVGGGRLGMPSDAIRGMLKKDIRSTAEMALRFVIANPNVSVALSGMQTPEMVEENAKVASIDGVLTGAERAQVEAMLEENKRLAELYCTGCKYCMPCPQKINIPHVFSLMNYHKVYGLTEYARREYKNLAVPIDERKEQWAKDRGADASSCVECKKCQSHCPQHIEIVAQLKETHSVLCAG
ncbi:MAG: aldo/keto reductase [Clostridiales bacterium]|jgi:predicted aldo/keto reductase-like oxidoreductase|nr:aldo/keto reductase [Clostridiales bacterium]